MKRIAPSLAPCGTPNSMLMETATITCGLFIFEEQEQKKTIFNIENIIALNI